MADNPNPFSADTKVKLAAAIYADYIKNEEVGNPNDGQGGAQPPDFTKYTGGHAGWVADLLNDDSAKVGQALEFAKIVDRDNDKEQTKVKLSLPKGTDLGVARAVYQKLRQHQQGGHFHHDY
jgi:hypothetical protein